QTCALPILSADKTPDGDRHHYVDLRFRGFAGAGLAWRTGDRPAVDLGDPDWAAPIAAGWHWQAGAEGLVLGRLAWWQVDGQVDFKARSDTYDVDLRSQQLD